MPPAKCSLFENPWLGRWLLITYLLCSTNAAASPTTAPTAEKSAEFCEHWKTYKDPQTGNCIPCSPCPENYITVVKCEFDRDTLCRPGTDLAKHIESVVKSSSVLVSQKNTTSVVIVEEETVFEQLLGGMEYSPVLVIILSISVMGCVLYIIINALKKHRNTPVPRRQLHDPLQESLLAEADDHDEETDKPAPNMDELLAQRYGRSLVKNVYVP